MVHSRRCDRSLRPSPPPLFLGCRKVTDFVRRRRWVRTQRPVTSEDEEPAAAAPLPPGSTSGEGGSGHGSVSPVRRRPKLLEALSFPKPGPVR